MAVTSVLVTGGAGYVGSHVALAFLDAGHRVAVLDNLTTGAQSAVDGRAHFVEGDVEDEALVQELLRRHGVGAVIHCAGSVSAPGSVARPLEHYRNNTEATRRLAQSAVACGVSRFLFSSSAAVYGAPESPLVDETAPPAPINPYGRSKWMAEQMLADAAAAHGLATLALRYFNVAGADPAGRAGPGRGGAGHLLKVAMEVATGARDHVPVFGDDFATPDGTGVRDYIHVSDLAQAHLVALESLDPQGGPRGPLNCGYGVGASVLDVLAAVERVAGIVIPRRIAPRRPGDPPALVACAEALRALGWTPRRTALDTLVADALAWERGGGPGAVSQPVAAGR